MEAEMMAWMMVKMFGHVDGDKSRKGRCHKGGLADWDDNRFQGIDGAMGPAGPDLGGSSAHGGLVTWVRSWMSDTGSNARITMNNRNCNLHCWQLAGCCTDAGRGWRWEPNPCQCYRRNATDFP